MPDSRVKLREPRIGLLAAIGRPVIRADEFAELGQLVELVLLVVAVQHVQRDHQLLERRVAGALAQPVGAGMHAGRARLDAGELGRHRHAEVVVRVHLDRQLGEALDPAHHVLDRLGQRAAHRVDDADRVGRRVLHHAGEHVGEIVLARARRVIGEVDGVQAALLGVVDDVDALAQHVFPGPLELVLELRIADRHLDDDAVAAAFERLVDVGVHRAGEGVDLRLQPELGNLLDRLEVHVGHRRHAGLDALDADFGELLGDRDLVLDVHDHAGRLLAVAQRRVVDLDACLGSCRVAATSGASL